MILNNVFKNRYKNTKQSLLKPIEISLIFGGNYCFCNNMGPTTSILAALFAPGSERPFTVFYTNNNNINNANACRILCCHNPNNESVLPTTKYEFGNFPQQDCY